MTRKDIDNIISIICPNDEDFEKPIISPAYLKKELETLALEQEPCDKYIKEIDHLRKYISKLETQIVEQEPYEDAISRQAVLDIMKKRDEELSSICPKDIRELPPVNPISNISIQITEREKYGRFN